MDPQLNPQSVGTSVACFLYERSADLGVDPGEMPSRDIKR